MSASVPIAEPEVADAKDGVEGDQRNREAQLRITAPLP